MKKTIENKRDGIKVILNPGEIFPNDPGQGTPVLVELATGETGTWNCVTSEGEVDGKPLTENQVEWLSKITGQVEDWMQRNGV